MDEKDNITSLLDIFSARDMINVDGLIREDLTARDFSETRLRAN